MVGGLVNSIGPSLGLTFSLYLTPMLIGERIAATLLFRRYERCANKHILLLVVFMAVFASDFERHAKDMNYSDSSYLPASAQRRRDALCHYSSVVSIQQCQLSRIYCMSASEFIYAADSQFYHFLIIYLVIM